MSEKDFVATLQQGYERAGPAIMIGKALYQQQLTSEVAVSIPLSTLNRHGLIAGATGTGKTKTIQLLAELLSAEGVPTLLMDLKGDLSGLAAAGESNAELVLRQQQLGGHYEPRAFPVELLTLSNELGVRLRATVTEFGPGLFAKMLGLNDSQTSLLVIIFKYAEDNDLPILDLDDARRMLQYAQQQGREAIEAEYGAISSRSAATILRKLVELQSQGAEQFFGEPSFNVADLMGKSVEGYAPINILRLTDIQTRAKLFSSFMLSLLAEIYQTFPEIGDVKKPKLMIFIDEAHLLFDQATDALLDQIDMIIKLIRSKGVGIIFCTQTPRDIPDSVLSQLGLKIQHALRAFTAKDRKAIKLIAENFPISEFYNISELITSLGIGEAAVTVLNEQGQVTPLAATRLYAPSSRMGSLSLAEISQLVTRSALVDKYDKSIEKDSASEILQKRLAEIKAETEETNSQSDQKVKTKTRKNKPFSSQDTMDVLEKLSKNRTVRALAAGVFAALVQFVLKLLGQGDKKISKSSTKF